MKKTKLFLIALIGVLTMNANRYGAESLVKKLYLYNKWVGYS